MLRIRVELCPLGDESNPETIHTLYIWNTGNTDCYGWTEYEAGCCPDYPLVALKHLREDGALRLVSRTLTALGTHQLRDWPTPPDGVRASEAPVRRSRKAKTPRSTKNRRVAREGRT